MRTPRRPTPAGSGPPPRARGRRAHAGPPADERAGAGGIAPAAATPASPSARGRHLRPRTVRAKVVSLLMVPVVSLLALWAFATVGTAQDVARLRQAHRVDATVRAPVLAAIAALQEERSAAVGYATEPATDGAIRVRALARQTDRAAARLRLDGRHTVADGADLPAGASARLAVFVAETDRLRALRPSVLARGTGWEETYGRYTSAIAAALAADGALSGVPGARPGTDARVLLEFSRAGEALAQEDAVLAGARRAGTLDGERLRLFTGAIGTRRALTDAATADLRGSELSAWTDLARSSDYLDVRVAEDAVLAARPGPNAVRAAPESRWDIARARVQDAMRAIVRDAVATGDPSPFRDALLTPAGAAVLFGLAAGVASLLISVRIGRDLVVELVSLRDSALDIARRKLPEAMRRVRAGETVDVRTEAPLGRPSVDETGQVAEALDTVHRAALRAAVERAELAGGISGVFVNLARRSQVLLHRQLRLLDAMERRSDDPDELGDLFRLDHLTTRMRRHAESLIILSGAAPGRAWRTPVPLTDVVRAAVSEVEDYARVEVRQLPDTTVTGAAVADLTHLLAEIVENAARFSPPHTRVRITGEPVGTGFVVEVEDRGLGMGEETLAQANERIERPEALDLLDSDRLGLFVVSRLSARHGIKVRLRTSPYGGTTAVVLLPTTLLHSERSDGLAAEDGSPGAAPSHDPPAASPSGPDAVRAVGERPALVPPATVAAAPEPPLKAARDAAPTGAAPLRLHRGDDAAGACGELPRRVRQAHLAPQLRSPRSEEPARTTPSAAGDERTPERVRAHITAYRDGWARGGGRPPGPPTIPAPRTGGDGSEGDSA